MTWHDLTWPDMTWHAGFWSWTMDYHGRSSLVVSLVENLFTHEPRLRFHDLKARDGREAPFSHPWRNHETIGKPENPFWFVIMQLIFDGHNLERNMPLFLPTDSSRSCKHWSFHVEAAGNAWRSSMMRSTGNGNDIRRDLQPRGNGMINSIRYSIHINRLYILYIYILLFHVILLSFHNVSYHNTHQQCMCLRLLKATHFLQDLHRALRKASLHKVCGIN